MAQDYANNILEAIEMIAAKRVNEAGYDKTIKAVVTSTDQAAKGQYTCKYESVTFTAIGTENAYKVDDTVMVNIPQNNWDNPKSILHKLYSEEIDYGSLDPFAEFLDVNDGKPSIVFLDSTIEEEGQQVEVGLKANLQQWTSRSLVNKDDFSTIYNEPFTRMGIEGSFKTLLKNYNVNAGTYGIRVIFTNSTTNTILAQYELNSLNSFGNLYGFEDYTPQKVLVKLDPSIISLATNVRIECFQMNDFTRYNTTTGATETLTYPEVSPEEVPFNILFKNLKLYFGYGKEEYGENDIILTTLSQPQYYKRWEEDKNTKNFSWVYWYKDGNGNLLRSKEYDINLPYTYLEYTVDNKTWKNLAGYGEGEAPILVGRGGGEYKYIIKDDLLESEEIQFRVRISKSGFNTDSNERYVQIYSNIIAMYQFEPSVNSIEYDELNAIKFEYKYGKEESLKYNKMENQLLSQEEHLVPHEIQVFWKPSTEKLADVSYLAGAKITYKVPAFDNTKYGYDSVVEANKRFAFESSTLIQHPEAGYDYGLDNTTVRYETIDDISYICWDIILAEDFVYDNKQRDKYYFYGHDDQTSGDMQSLTLTFRPKDFYLPTMVNNTIYCIIQKDTETFTGSFDIPLNRVDLSETQNRTFILTEDLSKPYFERGKLTIPYYQWENTAMPYDLTYKEIISPKLYHFCVYRQNYSGTQFQKGEIALLRNVKNYIFDESNENFKVFINKPKEAIAFSQDPNHQSTCFAPSENLPHLNYTFITKKQQSGNYYTYKFYNFDIATPFYQDHIYNTGRNDVKVVIKLAKTVTDCYNEYDTVVTPVYNLTGLEYDSWVTNTFIPMISQYLIPKTTGFFGKGYYYYNTENEKVLATAADSDITWYTLDSTYLLDPINYAWLMLQNKTDGITSIVDIPTYWFENKYNNKSTMHVSTGMNRIYFGSDGILTQNTFGPSDIPFKRHELHYPYFNIQNKVEKSAFIESVIIQEGVLKHYETKTTNIFMPTIKAKQVQTSTYTPFVGTISSTLPLSTWYYKWNNTFYNTVRLTQVIHTDTGGGNDTYDFTLTWYNDQDEVINTMELIDVHAWDFPCTINDEIYQKQSENQAFLSWDNLGFTTNYKEIGEGNDYPAETFENMNDYLPIVFQQRLLYRDDFAEWDGTKVQVGEDAIFSPVISAGTKSDEGAFTGLIMGDIGKIDYGVNRVYGLYGYESDVQSFGLKADGTMFLGKKGNGQILLDGNKSTIQSASYTQKNGSKGMFLDLDDAQIFLRNNDTSLTQEEINQMISDQRTVVTAKQTDLFAHLTGTAEIEGMYPNTGIFDYVQVPSETTFDPNETYYEMIDSGAETREIYYGTTDDLLLSSKNYYVYSPLTETYTLVHFNVNTVNYFTTSDTTPSNSKTYYIQEEESGGDIVYIPCADLIIFDPEETYYERGNYYEKYSYYVPNNNFEMSVSLDNSFIAGKKYFTKEIATHPDQLNPPGEGWSIRVYDGVHDSRPGSPVEQYLYAIKNVGEETTTYNIDAYYQGNWYTIYNNIGSLSSFTPLRYDTQGYNFYVAFLDSRQNNAIVIHNYEVYETAMLNNYTPYANDLSDLEDEALEKYQSAQDYYYNAEGLKTAADEAWAAAELVFAVATSDHDTASTTYNTALNTYNTAQDNWAQAQADWAEAQQQYSPGSPEYEAAKTAYEAAETTWRAAENTFETARTTYTEAGNIYSQATQNHNEAETEYNNAKDKQDNRQTNWNIERDNFNTLINTSIPSHLSSYNTGVNDFIPYFANYQAYCVETINNTKYVQAYDGCYDEWLNASNKLAALQELTPTAGQTYGITLDASDNNIYKTVTEYGERVKKIDLTKFPLEIGELTDPNFSVNWQGEMFSTAGKIGGWKIKKYSIESTDGKSDFKLTSNDKDYPLQIGDKFKVMWDGTVVAKKIKLGKGTLEGDEIDGASLKGIKDITYGDRNKGLSLGDDGYLHLNTGIKLGDNNIILNGESGEINLGSGGKITAGGSSLSLNDGYFMISGNIYCAGSHLSITDGGYITSQLIIGTEISCSKFNKKVVTWRTKTFKDYDGKSVTISYLGY